MVSSNGNDVRKIVFSAFTAFTDIRHYHPQNVVTLLIQIQTIVIKYLNILAIRMPLPSEILPQMQI